MSILFNSDAPVFVIQFRIKTTIGPKDTWKDILKVEVQRDESERFVLKFVRRAREEYGEHADFRVITRV